MPQTRRYFMLAMVATTGPRMRTAPLMPQNLNALEASETLEPEAF